MRRTKKIYSGLIKIITCFVALAAFAGTLSSAQAQNQYRSDLAWNSTELMDDIAGLFNKLCLNINWNETQKTILSNPGLYSIEQTENDNELYVKVRHPSVLANNKQVSVRLRNNYCQVAFFPSTGSVYDKFHEAILRNETVGLEYDHLTEYSTENKDGDENFHTYYKSDAWDYPSSTGLRVRIKHYHEEINGEMDKRVNARIYKYDRTKNPTIVELKGRPWYTTSMDEYDVSWLEYQIGGIRVDTGEGILTIWIGKQTKTRWEFKPNFYAQSSYSDYFFKTQSDIFVDDSPRSLTAYEKCKQGTLECEKAGNFFVMELDQKSIMELNAARKLEFQTVTVTGERYHIIISLEDFTSAYEDAKEITRTGKNPLYELFEYVLDGKN